MFVLLLFSEARTDQKWTLFALHGKTCTSLPNRCKDLEGRVCVCVQRKSCRLVSWVCLIACSVGYLIGRHEEYTLTNGICIDSSRKNLINRSGSARNASKSPWPYFFAQSWNGTVWERQFSFRNIWLRVFWFFVGSSTQETATRVQITTFPETGELCLVSYAYVCSCWKIRN